jgi:hypothetical protein
VEQVDGSGLTFFLNTVTADSTWQRPGAPPALPSKAHGGGQRHDQGGRWGDQEGGGGDWGRRGSGPSDEVDHRKRDHHAGDYRASLAADTKRRTFEGDAPRGLSNKPSWM